MYGCYVIYRCMVVIHPLFTYLLHTHVCYICVHIGIITPLHTPYILIYAQIGVFYPPLAIPQKHPKTTLLTSWPGPKPAYAKIPQNAAGIHTFRPKPVQDPSRTTPSDPPFWSFFWCFRCSPDTPYFDHFLDVCCFMLIPVIPDGAILVPCSAYIHFIPSFYTLVLVYLFYTLFLYPCFIPLFWYPCFTPPILIPCFGWCVLIPYFGTSFDTLFYTLFLDTLF